MKYNKLINIEHWMVMSDWSYHPKPMTKIIYMTPRGKFVTKEFIGNHYSREDMVEWLQLNTKVTLLERIKNFFSKE